ncbi:putative phage membrane protein [Erwinia sp. Ejp617]|nr:putative phage membrane protein [Erwinia sp. Ejp617]
MKIKMVAKISAFTGRAIPVVGWIILASDVSQIAYRTVTLNRITRLSGISLMVLKKLFLIRVYQVQIYQR